MELFFFTMMIWETCCPTGPPSPLTDALRRLEEAGVIRLLESLVGLSDEGGGPFHALLAAGDLLGELPQAHGLGEKQEPRSQMKGFGGEPAAACQDP